MDRTAEITRELKRAETARLAGNEGMARVCARRAAGIAAREFLIRHTAKPHNVSAYQALLELSTFPGLAPKMKQSAVHLTTRLTEEFSLPLQVDLIAEARQLIGGLS